MGEDRHKQGHFNFDDFNSDSLDADGFNSTMWVIAAPYDIRVLDFTTYSTNTKARNMNSVVFSPWATLSLPFVKVDILLSGLDKLMELLNCSFKNEPIHGHENSIIEIMEYSEEPWVYDFRKLLAEASTPLIGLGLRYASERNPLAHNANFVGWCVEKVVGFV